MTRAVMLIADGFQDEEGLYAYHRMKEEGWSVDVATPSTWRTAGEQVNGRPEQIFGKFGVPLKVTHTCDDLDAADYDLVLIPGGFKAPDVLRMRPEVLAFVRQMFEYNRLVAMICHAPWVGISAGIMRGRRATCYASLKDDLINAGCEYLYEPVVVDGCLITAPHYNQNGDFMRAVVEYVNRRTPAGPWSDAVHATNA